MANFTTNDVSALDQYMDTILTDIQIETREYNDAKKTLQKLKTSLEKEINEQISLLSGSVVGTIVAVISRLNGYEADILLFSEWQEQVNKCFWQLMGLRERLTTIQNSWKNVQNGFSTISNKIRIAKGHLSQEEWEEPEAPVVPFSLESRPVLQTASRA